MKSNKMYKSIATHSLVVAIFVNPYFLLTLTDIYRILFNDQSVITDNYSMFLVMSAISIAALTISAVSFFFTSNRYEWVTVVLAALFVLLAWQLSQFYLPLGIIPLLVAAFIIVFRISKHPKHTKLEK
jgi:hypothetical protein